MKSIPTLCRLTLLATLFAVAAPLTAQDRIPWITDLRQARDLAVQQNRLVLLHFWSESCGPCKQLERRVFNQPEFIRALTTGYVPAKVNVDLHPQIAKHYSITSVPTDIVVTPTGSELQRFTSKQDTNQYIAMLDGIRARASVNGFVPSTGIDSGVAANPYQDSQIPTANYGPPTSAANTGSTAPAKGYESRYSNPLNQPAAPQQQAIAPRYGNPYGAASEQPSPNQTSRWGQDSSNVGANPAGTQPTANPYVDRSGTPHAGQPPVPTQTANLGPGNHQAPAPPSGPSQATHNQFAQDHASPSQAAQHQLAPGQLAPNQPRPNPYAGNPQARPPQAPTNPQLAARTAPQVGAPAGQPNAPPASAPQFALDGYCPVTLVNQKGWLRGNTQWGARHKGHTYLFAGPQEQQQFLANPDLYAPLLGGYDLVQFAETGQLVPGKREFGLYVDQPGPIALFSDESTLQRFHLNSAQYINAIRQAQRQPAGQFPQR